jgi:hypothetical protein
MDEVNDHRILEEKYNGRWRKYKEHHVACMINTYKILGRKVERRGPVGRPRCE